MNTKDTLHIILNGGADEHVGLLRDGESVVVSVTERQGRRKLSVSNPLPNNAYATIAAQKKEIEELKRKLQAEEAKNDAQERWKAELGEKLHKSGLADYLVLLTEEHRAENIATRTALEERCFNRDCRLGLIKEKLRGFVASYGAQWRKGDWCIVWKSFSALHWWHGKQTDFVLWVREMGYDLSENTYKKSKQALGSRLDQWNLQHKGSDHFAHVVRGLIALFIGIPTKPTTSTFESAYIDHRELVGIVNLTYVTYSDTATGIVQVRAFRHVDSPGHAKLPYHAKRKCSRERIALASALHKIMGTFGLDADTRPGLSQVARTVASTQALALHPVATTKRVRSAYSLSRGVRLF